MGWNSTEPYMPAASAAVRLGVLKIGKGNPRASITLSKGVLKQLGNPDTCDVFIGEGEEAGQVLIQCDDNSGPHEIRELHKGGGKIVLNTLPDMPSEKRKPMGVRHQIGTGEGGEKQLTVWLPW
jgi:hypothetical protein